MKKIFVNSCIESNIKILNFLDSDNRTRTIINNFDCEFIQNLYNHMCLDSNIDLIKWIELKYNYINILESDYSNLFNACKANNIEFIEHIGTTKYIPSHIYEKMFKISLEQLNLPMLKIIYNLSKFINLCKFNNFILKKSYPPTITNDIINWLKSIGLANNYSLFVLENNKLCVYDNLIIKPLPLNNIKILVSISKISICEICMSDPSDIILDCTHKYCYYCIKEWSCKNNTCPTCRTEINELYRF